METEQHAGLTVPATDVDRIGARVAVAEAWVLAGRHAAAARLLREIAAALERRHAWSRAANVWQVLGGTWLERGRAREARAAFDESARAAVRGGQTLAAWDARAWAAVAATDHGDLETAETLGRSALDRSPTGARTIWAQAVLARVLLARGRADHVRVQVPGADADADLSPVSRAMVGGVAVRALLAEGCIFEAGIRARDELTHAGAVAGQAPSRAHGIATCIRLTAHLRVLCAAGDLELAEARLADLVVAARAARAPIRAWRGRAVWAAALTRAGRAAAGHTGARCSRFGRVMPPPDGAGAGPDTPVPSPSAAQEAGRWPSAADVRTAWSHLDAVAATRELLASVAAGVGAHRVEIRTAGSSRPLIATGDELEDVRTQSPAVVGIDTIAGRGAAAVPIESDGTAVAVLHAWWRGQPPRGAVTAVLEACAALVAPRVRALLPSSPSDVLDLVPELLGHSAVMGRVRTAIVRAAATPFPVLVEGESGSGKELAARAIHRLSPRARRAFGAVNCAALPDDLLDAELFGHAKGAFTGAVADRPGLFEATDGGTVFLDEVADLSARGQAKLLRTLQEQEIRRLGEVRSRQVDVRVVSAANRNLDAEARAGRFRHDLRYRLDVVHIVLPPLRERRDDVAVLARHAWQTVARAAGSRAWLADDAVAALAEHDWPGNVRELQNVLAAVVVSAPSDGPVRACLVRARLRDAGGPDLTLGEARTTTDRALVRQALARSGGRPAEAARRLGVSRQGLAKMCARLDVATGPGASRERASGADP